MRTITALMMFFTLLTQSQEYSFKAIESLGQSVKLSGTVIITTSSVTISTQDNHQTITANYKIINSTNDITQVTDGANTHNYFFEKKQGKKKGYKYDTILYFTYNSPSASHLIKYYLSKAK